MTSGLEDMFATYIRFLAPDLADAMTEQHLVGPGRRFKFDFAFPAYALGIELEGGLWARGSHSRPKGIQRDMEKNNFAVLHGWRVLRFSTDDIEGDPEAVIATIRAAIERRTA